MNYFAYLLMNYSSAEWVDNVVHWLS